MSCVSISPWFFFAGAVLLIVAAYCAGRARNFGEMNLQWTKISKEWADLHYASNALRVRQGVHAQNQKHSR